MLIHDNAGLPQADPRPHKPGNPNDKSTCTGCGRVPDEGVRVYADGGNFCTSGCLNKWLVERGSAK